MGGIRTFSLALTLAATATLQAQDAKDPEWQQIRPMLEKYCYDCHGGKKTKGGTDLKKLHEDPIVAKEFGLWNKVKEAVHLGDMPPEDDPQLSKEDKEKLMKWLGGSLEAAARANAGDPGIVTIRRLTNAEYDRTIHDLTGLEYGLAREFSPDGGGGEGFSNIGDVLFVSPQQLDKYLTAARKLADNATILPGSGVTFHPQRVGMRGPKQFHDQAEQALYVWYQKMAEPVMPKDGEDLREAEYMLAAWKFKYKAQTGAQSLEQLAKDAKLQPQFLQNWWNVLNNEQPKSRYLDLTRVPWRELPGPDEAKPQEVPAKVKEALAAIQAQRRSWWNWDKPGTGVQRMQQDSDGLRPYPINGDITKKNKVTLVVGDVGDGNQGDWVTISELRIEWSRKKMEGYRSWLTRYLDEQKKALQAAEAAPDPKPDTAPIKQRIDEAEKGLAIFNLNPLNKELPKDGFMVQAPFSITLPVPEDAARFAGKGQLDLNHPDADFATVQWTATATAQPDPTKIIPGVLTIWKRQTKAANETMRDFNVMKIAFPDENLRRLEEVARNHLRGGKGSGVYYLSDEQILSIIPQREKDRFAEMTTDWRLVRNRQRKPEEEKEWNDLLLKHLLEYASHAWRRPLAEEEKAELVKLYADARAKEMDRESAGREVLVRVMISPNFLFKLEDASQPGEHKVTPWELATRLSYFLWSSLPDEPLRKAAADGSLMTPEGMTREVKRMLRDPKAGALADEFAGQWLEFHGFAKHSTVDLAKFPQFTPELRRDMYREAEEFFTYLIREDRPVQEIIGGNYTFLNERLAAFYGVPNVKGDQFQKVVVSDYQRGGVLGMGALLTKTSRAHRTSPVLRGDWLLKSILGTPTPPPPPDVPELDDSAAKATTLRSRLEAHRNAKACSGCHDKIDPLGFALEAFDPIGRLRDKDDAGQPVDDSAQIKNGPQFKGVNGLREYLGTRQTEFNDLLCRKLLGFSLGRSVLPSDKVLLEKMREDLKKSGGHFSVAVLDIVQSRQFQNRRNE